MALLFAAAIVIGGRAIMGYPQEKPQTSLLTVRAAEGPFKVKATPEQSPFSGFGVYSRLPGNHEPDETVTLRPEPELPRLPDRSAGRR